MVNPLWLHGQAVKTPPFHGGNRGSNPLGVIDVMAKCNCICKIALTILRTLVIMKWF